MATARGNMMAADNRKRGDWLLSLRKLRVLGAGEWMATAAAAWSAATTPLFLFGPLGRSCNGAGVSTCSNPSIAALSPLAATVGFLIVALGLGILPFWLRRRREWLRVWAFFPLLVLFGTFGADVWVLPAGVLAFVASFFPSSTNHREALR